jgi:serine/threonine-protein kinase
MVKIGMIIADRYEVLEKIGTGGMSDVYKAKDKKLNRPVAVKVLKQEFSDNANFVSKFRVEAQAAAGLMHPNIVNVYDVGEENGINFIVMELVEGITLKKYIEKKARLSVKEAITIAIQIGMGIEAAHNNHIIHRDIKPQNVIISKEGKVKVTDFGIAKAASSNTITSNVMGSVHYTSPEQARGGYSDEKSDIYSLGITLFEMLTGRVPFNGETTVAIAIKQIQEEMPSPREYVDDIPVSVEQIVLKCTQKSPDRRYQNMSDLIEDLKKSFITPDEDFVKIEEDDLMSKTRPMSGEEMEALRKSSKSETNITEQLPIDPNAEDDEYDPKMEKITGIMAIIVGIVIVIVAFVLIVKATGLFNSGKKNPAGSETEISESVEQVLMPEVTNMDYEKAQKILMDEGFKVKLLWVETEDYKVGTVISSNVKAGLKVNYGSVIELTVSKDPDVELIKVPDIVGISLSDAYKILMDAGIGYETVEEYSDTVAEGLVMEQYPEKNTELRADSSTKVIITVSKGKAENLVAVPSVLGLTVEEAIEELIEAGLKVGTSDEVYNNIYEKGYVCYQSIKYNEEVEAGTVVDIQVSKGHEPEVEKTYSFNTNINAPTPAEDPEFESGTKVHIDLSTPDGKSWFSTDTTSFPVSVNLWNITGSSKGTITLKYTVTTKIKEVDPETGEETAKDGPKEERTITREITFIPNED